MMAGYRKAAPRLRGFVEQGPWRVVAASVWFRLSINPVLTTLRHAGSMRKFWIIFGFCVVLTGCDTPTVGFSYDQSNRLNVGENRFLVYYNDAEAQALRLNNQSLRGLKQAVSDGVTAIETVTGCEVKALLPKSDTVLTRASLKC